MAEIQRYWAEGQLHVVCGDPGSTRVKHVVRYSDHLADNKAALNAQAEDHKVNSLSDLRKLQAAWDEIELLNTKHAGEMSRLDKVWCERNDALRVQHDKELEAQSEEHEKLLSQMAFERDGWRRSFAESQTKLAEARGEGEPKIETSTFRKELTHLINFHSQENGSNTPDFILAQFLDVCLGLWNQTVRKRDTWYGENHDA